MKNSNLLKYSELEFLFSGPWGVVTPCKRRTFYTSEKHGKSGVQHNPDVIFLLPQNCTELRRIAVR